MTVTMTKTIRLYPIGDIAFIFNKRSRRKGKRILISDVGIFHDTRLKIDETTYKGLMKLMKERNTDLLTDGVNYYTTFGHEIGRIKHHQFDKELELEKINNPEYYLVD